MKKLFYLFFFFSFGLFAQGNSLFEQANAAYAEGNYELAIEKYNEILKRGKTDVAVHYNLANAHYKLNNIGPSIYHYEKALQLAPNDEDVLNNIIFARQMTLDAFEEEPRTGFSKLKFSVLSFFSTTGWAWAAIISILIFVALFLAYYFSSGSMKKRLFFISANLFLILAIVAVFMAFSRKEIEESKDFAVIFEDEVVVRNEPSERGEEIFLLHEGTKIRLLGEFQGWLEFELPNGSQGWLKKQTVKQL